MTLCSRIAIAMALAIGATPAATTAADTVVAAHTLRAGTVLAESDVAIIERETAGAARAVEEVTGLEITRNVYAGRPLLLGQLTAPSWVDRNDVVTLIYETGPLRIETEGRSLERGAEGERIRVMNLTSRRTVAGRVIAPRTVAVTP